MSKRVNKSRLGKILCLLLALCCLIPLGACTSGDGGKTASTADTDPRYRDLGGKTVKIFLYGYSRKDFSERLEKRYQELEKNFNCTIEVISGPSQMTHDAIWRSIVAGDPAVDIIDGTAPHLLGNPLQTGCYVDLNTFDVFNLEDEKWNREANATLNFYGKQYGVSARMDGPEALLNNQVMYFNKRLVKNAGYDPEDIYKWQEEGTWTWEKFEEIAEKIAKLSTSTNQIWGSLDNDHLLYDNLVISNGTDWSARTESGMAFTGGSEAAVEALTFYKKLYDKKIIPAVGYDKPKVEQFYKGSVGFVPDYLQRLGNEATFGAMADDFGVVMFPKGPRASDYRSFDNWYGWWSLPTGGKNNKEMALLIDCLTDTLYPDQEELEQLVTVFRESLVRDSESLRVFELIPSRSVLSTALMAEPIRTEWYNQIYSITQGEQTIAETLEMVESGFASSFETFWKIKQ